MTARLESPGPDQIEARLATMRADLKEAEQQRDAAAERARAVAVRGREEEDGPLDDYIQALALAEARVTTIQAAIAEMEAWVPEVREVQAATSAQGLATQIGEEYDRTVREYDGTDAVVAEAANTFIAALRRKEELFEELTTAHAARLLLAERFDFSPPDTTPPLAPALCPAVREAMTRLRKTRVRENLLPLPARIHDLNYSSSFGAWTVKGLIQRIAATEAGKLLEEAGYGHLVDEEGWNAGLRGLRKAKREEQDEELRRSIEEVDEWLRTLLAEGPKTQDEVTEVARAKGIQLLRGPESLEGAFERLDVGVCVREGEIKPLYWFLGRRAPEGFMLPKGSVRTAQMMGGMR